MYLAVACATRRTLPKVKSSATTPRQPSVPNLICGEAIALKVTGLARPLEGLNDLAHVLRTRARHHQERVFGVHDDHVLDADRGDEPAVTEDQAPGGVDKDCLAVHRVTARIGVHAVAELRPVADVRPIKSRGHEQEPVGLFHHAAVDDLDGKAAVEPCRGRLVARVSRSHYFAQTCEMSRRVPAELLDEDIDAPGEPG